MTPPILNICTLILRADIPFKPWEVALAVMLLLSCMCLVLLLAMYGRERRQARLKEVNFAKIELLSRLDHDLKVPLMMITSSLDRIRRNGKGNRPSPEFEEIEHGAQLLQDGIDQLLEIKSADMGAPVYRPAYGDLSRFVQEVTALYSMVNPSFGATLSVDTGEVPLMTEFDARKMRRIIYNLLNELYSRCGKGTEVCVKVTDSEGNALISVSAGCDSLKGDGKALSKALRSLGGTRSQGIGMKIVEDYVHLHGGSLLVSKDPKKGGFTVVIPVRVPQWEGVEETDGQRYDGTGKVPHILNVEDNPVFRTFITGRLSERFEVTEAANGKDALEMIAGNAFDLVLSDVEMPGMDGRELCRAIRADIRYSHMPVILLTSVPGRESELENLQAGADDSIEKPFDIETLTVRIERVLQRTGNMEEIPSGRRISRMDRELLDRIDAEIEKNMQDSEYTIENLCSSLNISRSGLYKKLMQLTGRSPLEYIRIKRLQVGRTMLESGENSVSQIAWSVGFSPKQFSKYFRDIYGCLPSEYIHHLSD